MSVPARFRVLAIVPLAFVGSLPVALSEDPPAAKPAPLPPELQARIPAELRYTRVPLPDDQNAFVLWSQAVGKFVRLDDPEADAALTAMLDEKDGFQATPGGQRVVEWIGKNKEALALVEAGIRRGRCRLPEVTGPDTEMPYLAPMAALARMKVVRAKIEASSGHDEAAARELSDVFRMGDGMAGGDGCLIDALVGFSILKLGAGGARWLCAQPGVSEKTLARLAADAAPAAGAGEGLARAFQVEFTGFFVPCLARPEAVTTEWRGMMAKIAAHPGALDMPATLDLGAGFYVRLVRNTRSPWSRRDRRINADAEDLAKSVPPEIQKVALGMMGNGGGEKEVGDALEKVAGRPGGPGNPVGRAIVSLLLPAMEGAQASLHQTCADLEAARTVAALRLYAMRKGHLPDSLQGLVDEKILSAVPVDPFSEKPFLYSKDRRRLWSVGEDEKDDGGKGDPDDRFEGKDYVWEIPPGKSE